MYLLLSFSRFKALGSPHSWGCLFCFFWRSLICEHCVFLFGLFQLVYLYCSTWSPLLMQHSRHTLDFKPFTFLPPTLYFLPLHPPHCFMFLAVLLHLLLILPHESLRILQWNAGGLRARNTELLHFISSR